MRSYRAWALWLVAVCSTAYSLPALADADLTITSTTGVPASINAGKSFSVPSTVTAQGGAVGSFTVAIYLSTDPIIDPTDVKIGSRTVSSLAMGASSTGSSTATIPAAVALGQYYVGAFADSANTVAETDETNNAAAPLPIIVTKPDLAVTSVNATPSTLPAGGQLSITTTVLATGTSVTSFAVRYYLSPDPEITASDTSVGSRTVTSLAAGASSTATTTVPLPAGLTGPYYVGAIADASDQIAELDEDNNATTGPLVTTTKSDLRVTSIGATATTVGAQGQLSIQSSVQATAAGTDSFVVRFYLSSDAEITSSDTQVGSRSVSSLAAGATSTATTTVTLPAGFTGQYTLGAIVDANDEVPELNESNNALAGPTITINKPDLRVTALSAAATTVGAQGQLSIQSGVQATGGAATSFVVRFYLSSDAEITSSDTLVGSRSVTSLAAGATSSATTNVTLPAGLTGSYSLGAIVDAADQVPESDEGNNAAAGPSIRVTKPDLTITEVASTTTAVAPGGRFSIVNTVRAVNGASTSFVVRLYLSADPEITSADIPLGSRTVNSLASGATHTATTSVTVPNGVTGSDYYLGAIVDADGDVDESDEGNNGAPGTVVTVTKPDLIVTALTSTPGTVMPGGQLTITSSAQANGGAVAAFTVRFYLSPDEEITAADVPIGSRVVSSLASGATSNASTSITLPADLIGTFFVGAIVDADGQVSESDETNNARAGTQVEVRRPDLTMTVVTASPTSVASGATLGITSTVQAQGGAVGSFVVRFYLSRDPEITIDDIAVAFRTVSALASGASSTAMSSVTLPAGVSGTYYVGAIADANGQVTESDEGNNALAGTVVTVSRPDLAPTALTASFIVAGQGGTLSITDTVKATGGAAPSFRVRYVLSPDPEITSIDRVLGTRTVTSLASGASSTETMAVALPDGVNGAFYVGAIVDVDDQVDESNEANNAKVGPLLTITPADLTVSVSADPTTVDVGGQLAISDTVSARGGGVSPVVVRYFLSSDGTIGIDDLEVGSRFVSHLVNGQVDSATTTIVLPLWLVGTYTVGAIVDADGQAAESDETNNAASGPLVTVRVPSVTAPPTLEVTSPAEELTVTTSSVVVTGRAEGESAITVRVAGVATPVALDGAFSQEVALALGDNLIDVVVADAAGSQTEVRRHVYRIASGPLAVSIINPRQGFVVNSQLLVVQGIITGGNPHYSAAVNGVPASVAASGAVTTTISIPLGASTVRLQVTDASGGNAQATATGSRVSATSGGGGGSTDWCEPAPGTAFTYDAAGHLTGVYDTASDPAHCGCIGHACSAAAPVCRKGTCGTSSGGSFVNTSGDPANCGAAGHVCPGLVNGTASCENGTCTIRCATGYAPADGVCMNLVTDPLNCGARGHVCPGRADAAPVCRNGLCSLDCNPEYAQSDDQCIDVNSDPSNCGTIGTSCPTGPHGAPVCSQGSCSMQCEPGFDLSWFGECIDVYSDPRHCGAYFNACSSPTQGSSSCVAGQCTVSCNPGYVSTGWDCVDLSRDPQNCGSLGAACTAPSHAGPTCELARCGFVCDSGYALVGGRCAPIDTTSDPTNCGSLGSVCASLAHGRPRCLDGVCAFSCDPGYGPAGAACVASTDPQHCGPSDSVCPGVDHGAPICIQDACAVRCEDGFDRFGGACVDVSSSPTDCGWAGHVCPTVLHGAPACNGGRCGIVCDSGFQDDGGNCIDVTSDPRNCGSVGNVCAGADRQMAVCTAGTCGLAPPPLITGVSRLRTLYVSSYDPATGLLQTNEDHSGLYPESVASADLDHEFTVLSVAPEGLYLEPFLDPAMVVQIEHDSGMDRPFARVAFPYGNTLDDVIDLATNDGLILRGSGLTMGGETGYAGHPGTLRLVADGREVPGSLGGWIVAAGDRVIVQEIFGATERSAYVEFTSPAGSARTPWPLRWHDSPRITRVEAAGFSCLPAQFSCPSHVAYGTPITISGDWLRDVDAVRLWRPFGTNPPWEDVPRPGAQSQPESFEVVDDKHVVVVLDPAGGPVERGLYLLSTYYPGYGFTYDQEPFPGVRQICLAENRWGDCAWLNAAASDTPAIRGGRILRRSGYQAPFADYDIGRIEPASGDRLVFQPNGFSAADIQSLSFVRDGASYYCPARAVGWGGDPVAVRFPDEDPMPGGSCRMVVTLRNGLTLYSSFTFNYVGTSPPPPPPEEDADLDVPDAPPHVPRPPAPGNCTEGNRICG